MPYIIHVPANPRPYITNDPRIYFDCTKVFGWTRESRPFSDPYCKDVRAKEDMQHQSDRRREQLERYWLAELNNRQMLRQKAEVAQVQALEKVEEPAPTEQLIPTTLFKMSGDESDKRDSGVFVEVQESVIEDIRFDTNDVPAPWISLKQISDQFEFSLEMEGGPEDNPTIV